MLVVEEKQEFIPGMKLLDCFRYDAVSERFPFVFVSTLFLSNAVWLHYILLSFLKRFSSEEEPAPGKFPHKYQIHPVLLNIIFS